MACNRHPVDKRVPIEQGEYFGIYDDDTAPEDGYVCGVCGVYVPESRSRRGRTANRRGRNQSARIAKDIGGVNREVEGKPFDVTNEMYAVQSKKDNGLFPERIWKALAAIPAGELVPVLVIRDAPGRGRRVRGVAVLRYEDFVDVSGVKA